jgi:cytochrome subunit of sulfide dehydrogenase
VGGRELRRLPPPAMLGSAAPIFVFAALGLLLSGTVASAEEREPAALADACASCHGIDGRSQGAIPSLAGMSAAQFVARMVAFRSGDAEATVMDRIAPGISPAETERLADYFADLR